MLHKIKISGTSREYDPDGRIVGAEIVEKSDGIKRKKILDDY